MQLNPDREPLQRAAARRGRHVKHHLTFWMRPDFVIRCARRFQTVTGFDRAIALASLAFTAMIPLGILVAELFPGSDLGQRIVDRLNLEGDGAAAVERLFSGNESLASGFSIGGFFILVLAALSFARAMQRVFESTWDVPMLSIRNSLNGLRWIGGLMAWWAVVGTLASLDLSTTLHRALTLVVVPAGVAFAVWSGMVLTSRRIGPRLLLPGAIVTVLVLAIYGAASDLYLPGVFNGYVSRYGALGVTFALISWFFGAMVCIVGSTAVGREISDELASIRRGERPSTAQIDAEWAQVREQVDEGRATLEERRAAWRARRAERRAKEP